MMKRTCVREVERLSSRLLDRGNRPQPPQRTTRPQQLPPDHLAARWSVWSSLLWCRERTDAPTDTQRSAAQQRSGKCW